MPLRREGRVNQYMTDRCHLKYDISRPERWIKNLRDEKLTVFRGAPKTGGYYVKEGAVPTFSHFFQGV